MENNLKLYAVAGNPILHSKSPIIHNAGFTNLEVNAHFTRLAVDSAKEIIDITKNLSIDGLCITAPFKEKIVELLEVVDSKARIIGSVNTIVNKDGVLHGYNTDFIGVVESIKTKKKELIGAKCLVIGTGGAARAAIYGMVEAGADVTITGRKTLKAYNIASELVCKSGKYVNLESLIKDNHIIINTIPGDVDVYRKEWFGENHIILDANYKDSILVDIAKEKNCEFIDGVNWLVHQAIPAFKRFTDFDLDKEIMFQALSSPIHVSKSIAITGFMGAGKTEVGKLLAAKFELPFIDTDTLIEKDAKMTINDIFINKGQAWFRTMEKQVFSNIDSSKLQIVSTGGGIIKDSEINEKLKTDFITIWLSASPDACMERAESSNRPLISESDSVDDVSMLLYSRIDDYAKSSYLMIETDDRNIEEVVNKIYEEISSTGILKS